MRLFGRVQMPADSRFLLVLEKGIQQAISHFGDGMKGDGLLRRFAPRNDNMGPCVIVREFRSGEAVPISCGERGKKPGNGLFLFTGIDGKFDRFIH